MPTLTPSALVVGAPRRPLPFGLFSVFAPRQDVNTPWQGGGVQWEYLSCSDLDPLIGPVQDDLGALTGLPKNFDEAADSGADTDGVEDAQTFTVYGRFKATPIAWRSGEAQDRALQKLLTFEERSVESEFWNGTLGGGSDLSSPTSVGSVAYSDIVKGLGLLEEFIATNYGSLGVMHMSRGYALELLAEGALTTRGTSLTTELGTPVVAGSGYSRGSMKASPAVFGYRSEPFYSSSIPYDLLDKTNNDLYAIAERTYLLGFDPCGVGSVTVTDS